MAGAVRVIERRRDHLRERLVVTPGLADRLSTNANGSRLDARTSGDEMTTPTAKRSPEEVAERGQEIFERRVRPQLKPEDDGKYVAIDIASEEYEVDVSDIEAVMRLRQRMPGAEMWLMRAGYPAAYKLGLR